MASDKDTWPLRVPRISLFFLLVYGSNHVCQVGTHTRADILIPTLLGGVGAMVGGAVGMLAGGLEALALVEEGGGALQNAAPGRYTGVAASPAMHHSLTRLWYWCLFGMTTKPA